MTRPILITAAAVLLSITSLTALAQQQRVEPPHRNFSFRFEFGCAAVPDVYDSFTRLFVRTWVNFPERKEQRVLVVLSAPQMDHIHRAIHDINFFDYPPQFVGVQQVEQTIVTIPHLSYLMEVRESGAAHRVRWTDSTKPTTEQADRLRALFSSLMGFLRGHSEVKKLPPQYPCE